MGSYAEGHRYASTLDHMKSRHLYSLGNRGSLSIHRVDGRFLRALRIGASPHGLRLKQGTVGTNLCIAQGAGITDVVDTREHSRLRPLCCNCGHCGAVLLRLSAQTSALPFALGCGLGTFRSSLCRLRVATLDWPIALAVFH